MLGSAQSMINLLYSIWAKEGLPIFKRYDFSTNYDFLNLFVLFDVEFNCISVSGSINENT